MIKEKMMKKSGKTMQKMTKKGKTKKKCTCGLDGHKTSECFSKSVVMAAI